MIEKRIIQAFPKPKWIDTISCDGKPCGGASGCGSGTTTRNGSCQSEACNKGSGCDMEGMLAWFSDRHRDEVEVQVADYSSLRSIQMALDDLNEVLQSNGEDLRVTLDNLELVFSQIAPIVAIDKTLAFVGKSPTEDDLLEALEIQRQ